jgi:aldehyde dehydrogenase (NAD+)
MRIAQKKIFGPVIEINEDFDDAIEKANGIGFGLSAGIVTNDLQKAFAFANRIEAGVVKINEPTSGIGPHAPFGGFFHIILQNKPGGRGILPKTIYVGHG